MNDTVQKLMSLVQAYASDYAHALMVTGVGSDPRDSRKALEDELTRLFTTGSPPPEGFYQGSIVDMVRQDPAVVGLAIHIEEHGITGESK